MLENIDLNKKMSRKEFNERYDRLCDELSKLQREQRAAKLPVLIVFEGVPSAGKGTQINKLIEPLDPRGFHVYAINGQSDEEKRHPFFWRFWTLTPADGRIAILDRSWYRSVMVDRFDGTTPPDKLEDFYKDINEFEKQLTFGGTLIIKFFLNITKDEQKKRMKALLASKETAWRVTENDLARHKKYKEYQTMADEMLQHTDTAYAPWTIVESNDLEYAACKIMDTVIRRLKTAIPEYIEKVKEAEAEKAAVRAYNAQKYANVDVEQMKAEVENSVRAAEDAQGAEKPGEAPAAENAGAQTSGTGPADAGEAVKSDAGQAGSDGEKTDAGRPDAADAENAGREEAGEAGDGDAGESLSDTDEEVRDLDDETGSDNEAAVRKAVSAGANVPAAEKKEAKPQVSLKTSILSNVDLTKSVPKSEYKTEIKKLQRRLSFLHSELYRTQIPVVIGFEGWDAGGKGGAIKRLTQALDPRGYAVNPTSAANDIERAHNYLWRFWNNMPKNGHIAIFDRTWYGRVMVERIEGFCTKDEWQRAYTEINNMEANLVHSGAIVLKFWMQIDKDEQARRFKERMDDPSKQWKITDEDWRNRAKWDDYENAVDEMLIRTSTTYAPWIIVEGNDKYYARLKVLRTVIDAIENKLKETGR
ncbi:MAG: hypothetical protein ACOX8B_05960 [Lachnospiraceae bacterium]|jgi:polyphosphate kinase 2 (PPK2 family)